MKKMIALTTALLIGAAGAAFAQKQETAKPMSAPVGAAKADVKSAPAAVTDTKKDLMDINTASEKELATLPKIGDVRAKAIVKGRPYNGKDDLINKKVIPQDAYDAIKEVIIAKQIKKEESNKVEKKK